MDEKRYAEPKHKAAAGRFCGGDQRQSAYAAKLGAATPRTHRPDSCAAQGRGICARHGSQSIAPLAARFPLLL